MSYKNGRPLLARIIGVFFIFSSFAVFASEPDKITVKITDLNNINGNGALEACGTAVHKDGIKPLMVTIKHDQSYYTVLSGPNDRWCVLFKRWNYSGTTDASATTLQKSSEMKLKPVSIQ